MKLGLCLSLVYTGPTSDVSFDFWLLGAVTLSSLALGTSLWFLQLWLVAKGYCVTYPEFYEDSSARPPPSRVQCLVVLVLSPVGEGEACWESSTNYPAIADHWPVCLQHFVDSHAGWQIPHSDRSLVT